MKNKRFKKFKIQHKIKKKKLNTIKKNIFKILEELEIISFLFEKRKNFWYCRKNIIIDQLSIISNDTILNNDLVNKIHYLKIFKDDVQKFIGIEYIYINSFVSAIFYPSDTGETEMEIGKYYNITNKDYYYYTTYTNFNVYDIDFLLCKILKEYCANFLFV